MFLLHDVKISKCEFVTYVCRINRRLGATITITSSIAAKAIEDSARSVVAAHCSTSDRGTWEIIVLAAIFNHLLVGCEYVPFSFLFDRK